jgi:signal transduction histidine kinase
VALFSERAQLANVKLEVAKPEEDILVLCRGAEICQVLMNLLTNALDAVEGSASAWVKLEVKEAGKMAEISVCDSGTGIPQGLRSRILEPFFTTKEPGKGLGLGLSISRTIVEAHGGKLVLNESVPYTRFTFTLPIAQEEATP